MYDDRRNSGDRRAPKGETNPDNFELNITDEMFETMSEIDMDNLGETQSFTAPKRDSKEEGTRAYYSDNESKQQKKEHKKRDKLKSIKNRRVFRIVWWAMVILVALTLASYLIAGSNDLFAVGRPKGTVSVEIPEKTTPDELADILKADGVIKAPEFFKLYCKMTASHVEYFDPGSYNVDTNLDYEGLINFLLAGTAISEKVDITFQEGLSVQAVAELLEKNKICKAEDILKAVNTDKYDKYDMIGSVDNASNRYYKLEGYLFPDTYTFTTGEEIDSVLGKMLFNFQNKITVEMMEKIDASDYSLDQIITLASIIQAEAADKKDMYNVSAVLHNRLEFGDQYDIFTLGCDSTVFYPYKSGSVAPVGYVSNYSTYEVQGLPAGAICNPGVDAIKAAISPNPDSADYLYFCHSAEGVPFYASSAEQHEQNLIEAGLND